MEATVDTDTCIGCELCVQLCPEVFKMSDGKAMAYLGEVPEELNDKCKEAADSCPVNAITIEE